MGDLFTEKSGDGRIHPQRSSESLPLPLPLPLPRNTFTWNDGNGIQKKKKKTRLLPLKDCHYVELVILAARRDSIHFYNQKHDYTSSTTPVSSASSIFSLGGLTLGYNASRSARLSLSILVKPGCLITVSKAAEVRYDGPALKPVMSYAVGESC